MSNEFILNSGSRGLKVIKSQGGQLSLHNKCHPGESCMVDVIQKGVKLDNFAKSKYVRVEPKRVDGFTGPVAELILEPGDYEIEVDNIDSKGKPLDIFYDFEVVGGYKE